MPRSGQDDFDALILLLPLRFVEAISRKLLLAHAVGQFGEAPCRSNLLSFRPRCAEREGSRTLWLRFLLGWQRNPHIMDGIIELLPHPRTPCVFLQKAPGCCRQNCHQARGRSLATASEQVTEKLSRLRKTLMSRLEKAKRKHDPVDVRRRRDRPVAPARPSASQASPGFHPR